MYFIERCHNCDLTNEFQGLTREFIDEINETKREYGKRKNEMKEVNFSDFKSFFGLIAKDVGVQKKRIGGNFAVAHAVNNQELREYIRQIVPDVIFITLTLTKETQRKRIQVFVNTKYTVIERFHSFKNSTSGSTW